MILFKGGYGFNYNRCVWWETSETVALVFYPNSFIVVVVELIQNKKE